MSMFGGRPYLHQGSSMCAAQLAFNFCPVFLAKGRAAEADESSMTAHQPTTTSTLQHPQSSSSRPLEEWGSWKLFRVGEGIEDRCPPLEASANPCHNSGIEQNHSTWFLAVQSSFVRRGQRCGRWRRIIKLEWWRKWHCICAVLSRVTTCFLRPLGRHPVSRLLSSSRRQQ